MTYKIIGDSCTDLTAEMLQDPHFVKVPLSIQVGPETILDDSNFHQGELLQKMRAWPTAPKTACPSPAQYLEQFAEGADNYVVTLTARLSGSYNAAVQALSIYQEEGGTAIGLGDKTVPLGQLHDLLPVLVRQAAEQISGW